MRGRKVLLPGNWRIAWLFAALLVLVSVLYPLQAPRAHATWCADIDVVVVRGTGEPGWLGDVVGNPLYGQLQQRLPVSLSAYPVAYPADHSFNLGAGTADLVGHLAHQAGVCPAQRIILAGYSQGAAVIHAALGTGNVSWYPGRVQLPGDLAWRISSVLLFGDPLRAVGAGVPGEYAWRTGNWCTGGDPICGGGMNAASHVSYGHSFVAAANFAAGRL
ncbi:cutinase family protein [Nocardia otitidiscaviarum]|uniref:Cutinase family protein n=1 Tax=Nocardia otitidiscaviarum TaxID=1823 RepID=A0A516NK18_9NOCA|nr:cutinase family protein [Nocardia otitidiscaviarum]MCP9619404.1 cutinase family protein [Nocardia otitidiscaviarum]QDP79229.1 cutinase family protein [Nocardia otitidiscaviarum]